MTDGDREPEQSAAAADMIERSIRQIAIAIVLAGALVALAIYWHPGPPHYQVVAMGDQIVRLNMNNGTLVACNVQKCGLVLRESRGIDPNRGFALLPPQAVSPPPAPRQIAPAPAPVPPAPRPR